MSPSVTTVLGETPPAGLGLCDAHNHLWIEEIPGRDSGLPRLDDEIPIAAELTDYRVAGGGAIVDCQPGGCGRDGRMLHKLSQVTGVQIVASTGFHLAKYYPKDAWLFQATAQQAQDYFVQEIVSGLSEALDQEQPARAGCIKIACAAFLEDTPQALLEAAAGASLRTGAALLAHTEKGSAAEAIYAFFSARGVPAGRLTLCHLDKRPDFGLHRELAREGVLLEYDTFYRPKYAPERNLWPLLVQMVEHGFAGQVSLATDMAEAELWAHLGGGPGLAGFLTIIKPRLEQSGMDAPTVNALLGGNIAKRLAF